MPVADHGYYHGPGITTLYIDTAYAMLNIADAV